jgi:hypothetical protein
MRRQMPDGTLPAVDSDTIAAWFLAGMVVSGGLFPLSFPRFPQPADQSRE